MLSDDKAIKKKAKADGDYKVKNALEYSNCAIVQNMAKS